MVYAHISHGLLDSPAGNGPVAVGRPAPGRRESFARRAVRRWGTSGVGLSWRTRWRMKPRASQPQNHSPCPRAPMRTKVNRLNRFGDFRFPAPRAWCMSLSYSQCRAAVDGFVARPSSGGATSATHSWCQARDALTRGRDVQAFPDWAAVIVLAPPPVPGTVCRDFLRNPRPMRSPSLQAAPSRTAPTAAHTAHPASWASPPSGPRAPSPPRLRPCASPSSRPVRTSAAPWP